MFSRVLVANRGEIAVRVIRALHELGVEAVAVYSTADADSLHVRLADEAVCIGPPPANESYLSISNVIGAAETTGCQAVHPGYGFLSENPNFVEACEETGFVFIGPSADLMRRMGDKSEAKRELQAAGGYPILLKAAAGGGGKGMRFVSEPSELKGAFQAAKGEAEAAFGDGGLYAERALVPTRHIEVQVLCDSFGGVLTLGERECSIQRRHQKLIEESPSPALTPELREQMEQATEHACGVIGYTNAGTFEFLLSEGEFYFMELNARLQVEHPVSELVTDIDIVREQIRIAAGEPLELTGRAPRLGHAIEMRLNAEDPSRGFVPTPGRLERFRPPLGPGVRIDTFVEEGMEIQPFYDSLLAKLIVQDSDRPATIERALRALGELRIEGVPTTVPVIREIIDSAEFRSGEYSTSFIAEAAGRLPALLRE